MWKKIAIALTLAPLWLGALEIRYHNTYTRMVKPERIVADVSLRVKAQSEHEAIERLGRFERYVDERIEGVKVKGGNYHVAPRYRYEQNKRLFDGYEGAIEYRFESDDAKQIASAIEKFTRFSKGEGAHLRIGGVYRTVSEARKERIQSALRRQALKLITQDAKRMGEGMSQQCKIKSVDFKNPTFPRPVPMAKAMVALDGGAPLAPVPKADKQAIALQANVVLECTQ